MSIQQPNNIQTGINPVNIPTNIFGQGMLYSAFTNGGTFTAKNYLFALSFNHLEKLLGTVFTKANNYLEKVVAGEEKDTPIHKLINFIYSIFSKVFQKLRWLKEKIYKQKEIKLEIMEEQIKENKGLSCQIVSEFKECFWQALLKDKNLSYKICKDCSFTQNEKASFYIKESWEDIILKNEEWSAQFLNKYEMIFQLNESGKILYKNPLNNVKLGKNDLEEEFKVLLELNCNENQTKELEKYEKSLIKQGDLHFFHPNKKNLINRIEDFLLIIINDRLKSFKRNYLYHFSNHNSKYFLKSKFISDQFIKNGQVVSNSTTANMLFFLSFMFYHYYKTNYKNKIEFLTEFNKNKGDKYFLGLKLCGDIPQFFHNIIDFFTEYYSYYEELLQLYKSYCKDEELNFIINWVCVTSILNPTTDKFTHNNVENSIILSSDTIYDENVLKQSFFQYCIKLEKSVYQNNISSDLKNKIKVYTISLEDKETITTLENPEYKSWLEKFNEIKEVSEDKSVLAELVKDAPSKILTSKTMKKDITCKEINEVYKDFKTMYLSQTDKQHLISVLHNYKHKKQLLNDLGFPNKLGVMLYGLPGCGKTSTIITIASYLQKNIYYLNLNGIKTNEDLSTIFDHVTKLSANGGIIVMEDIDAMTKVVHKRNYKNCESSDDEYNKNSIYEGKQKLTLEFFLNLLQGSLTRDDTIFITTTNHIEVLDPAFYRDGRFDVKIEMKPADKYQINEMFKVFFNRDIKEELLNKIPEHKIPCATFLNHFYKYLMNSEKYTDEDILNIFVTC